MSTFLVLIVAGVVCSFVAGLPLEGGRSAQPDPRQNDVFIHKQFYTHTGPESASERKVIFGKPKINYKVVFVKIPSSYARFVQSGKKPLSVSLAPVEERLALYVLTKKEENQEHEVVRFDIQPQSTPPPPEVHFIKYKNQDEAAAVQSQIRDQYEELRIR